MAALGACGCYALQAARGEVALLSKRVPIARAIADPATPAAVRSQLEKVRAIREFASRELGLPDNGSYRSYADIGRDSVVWNVYATAEFSVQPRQWCYPLAGCVAYRGYFEERQARAYAGKLRARGLDVSVGGVAAYSTLGHFDDPVISTMMGWNDVQLAAILFHELTHQLLYVPGDSSFNEALATLIEEEGVRRWLAAQGRDQDLAGYVLRHRRYQQLVALLIDTRTGLAGVYASNAEAAVMRDGKRAAFERLRNRYAELKASWDGYAGYDGWVGGEMNNAVLASVATYEACVPGFRRLLEAEGGDLGKFYDEARRLARLPAEQRTAAVCASRG